jgi:hypothetical protein
MDELEVCGPAAASRLLRSGMRSFVAGRTPRLSIVQFASLDLDDWAHLPCVPMR